MAASSSRLDDHALHAHIATRVKNAAILSYLITDDLCRPWARVVNQQ